MFNGGVRGARARDGQGITSPQAQYVQNASPQPSITGYAVQGADDTALATTGGQTVIVSGSGFATGISVVLDGATISPVTRISDTQISFTSPAKSGGSYTLIVYNPTGGGAILVPGLNYSAVPTWTTSAGSIGSVYETATITNKQVVATSDSSIVYTLASGSLPSGATLNSNGTITGTSPIDGSSTTYTFAVTATDAELQDTTRTFTLTVNVDVVTWVTPAPSANITLDAVAADITLSATSAAGFNISSYAANNLPDGLTLSNGVISGTPTVPGSFTSVLSATAATSGRTGTNTINWTIVLGDSFFTNTVLLLPGAVVTSLSDMSTYNHQLVATGAMTLSKDDPFSRLEGGSYYMNSYNQYITIPAGTDAFQYGTGDYTLEMWVRFPSSRVGTTGAIFDYRNSGGGLDVRMELSNGTLIYKSGGTTLFTGPTYVFFTDAGNYTAGGWRHFAISRSSGSTKVFIDGIQHGSTFTDNTNYSLTSPLRIFGVNTGGTSEQIPGHVSNVRVVKGTALYTTGFTKPTQPPTAVTGTTLLALQTTVTVDNNSIIDFSSNRRGITRNGNVSQGSFSPYGENWSTYFPSTNNSLSFTNTGSQLSLGTGNFTIEYWVDFDNPATTNTYNIVLRNYQTDPFTTDYFYIGKHPSATVPGAMSLWLGNIAGLMVLSDTSVPSSGWNHFAIVRNSNTWTMYRNGSAVHSVTSSVSMGTRNNNQCDIGVDLAGHLSNLRIVKGTAVYTSNFTPSTTPLPVISGTSLLTCQDAYPIDESPNGFAMTRSAGLGYQAFNPFTKTSAVRTGNYSLRCRNGLVLADYNDVFNLTGDFTIECWIYVLNTTSSGMVMVYAGGDNIAWASYELAYENGYINFAGSSSNNGYDIGSEPWTSSTGRLGAIAQGAWYHVAVTRSGNNYRGFVNGVQGYSQTTSLTPYTQSTRGLWLGGNYGTPYAGSNTLSNFNGYISNFRIVKGTALYTANFTPPTSPLTAVSGTSILTCQNDRLQDNSTNNHAVYLPGPFSGRMTTTEFSPFTSSVTYTNKLEYSPTTFGGSLSFDGTGDYLSVADSMNAGTGDFTLQAWVNPTSWVEWQSVFSTRASNAASSVQWCLGVNQTGYPYVYSDGFQVQGSAGQVSLNQWTHLCVTRRGSAMRMFVNGSQVAANTSTSQNYTDTVAAIGANRNGTEPWTGYITDLQFIKGNALYVSPFVPTRSPLTSTANTALLLSSINGGIRDASAKTVVETVGDTKLSLSVGKFSRTYSMFFDGTGDGVRAHPSTNLAFGSDDLTIEFWYRPTSTSGTNPNILCNNNGSGSFTSGQWSLHAPHSSYANKYSFWVASYSTGSALLVSTSNIATNTWSFITITRSGNTWRLFIDGTIEATATHSGVLDGGTAVPLFIGYQPSVDSGRYITGYIQDLRLTKGRARYTSNFTAPLSSLPAK